MHQASGEKHREHFDTQPRGGRPIARRLRRSVNTGFSVHCFPPKFPPGAKTQQTGCHTRGTMCSYARVFLLDYRKHLRVDEGRTGDIAYEGSSFNLASRLSTHGEHMSRARRVACCRPCHRKARPQPRSVRRTGLLLRPRTGFKLCNPVGTHLGRLNDPN